MPMKECESSEMLPATEGDILPQPNDVPESEEVEGGMPSESLPQQLEEAVRAGDEVQSVTPSDKRQAGKGGDQSFAEHEPVVEEAVTNEEEGINESKEAMQPEAIISDQGAIIEDIKKDADRVEEIQQVPNPGNELQEIISDIQIEDDIDVQDND